MSSQSVLHFDFETRSAADLKVGGADVYAAHPTTDALCAAYAFDDEPVQLWKLGEKLPVDVGIHVVYGGKVVAHNAPFELAIWNKTCLPKYGWPPLTPEQTFCTMAMAYAMSLPGSLEGASAAVGIEHKKDMAGNRIMLQLAQPRKRHSDGSITWWEKEVVPEKFDRLYAYCMQDIEVERDLYKRLMHLSPAEREMWLIDYRINQRGLQVDVNAASVALELAEYEQKRLNERMREVTGNGVATCNATGQMKDWLISRGIQTKGVAKADVTELLERDDLPADVREALLLRQEAAKSSVKKLKTMLGGVGEDGRMRGIFQYHGANTGRWAGRRVQPHNFPRPSIDQSEIDMVFKLMSNVTGGVG